MSNYKLLQVLRRSYSTVNNNNNNEIKRQITNRNPRNLEKMRIAYKPSGYHLEKPGRCYWHKLKLTVSERHVTACIDHFENGPILEASTKEWAVKKQLYRTYDTAAFINVARVLAQRCLESGITEVRNDIKPASKDGKVASFLKTLEDNGVTLTESEQFMTARPWDMHRPEKPWEITE